QPLVDFGVSQARKQKVVDQLWKGLQGLLTQRKVTTFAGTGSLGPNHTVTVDDGTELVGTNIILAAGSVPRSLPGFDIDGRVVLTSDEVLSLTELPQTAVVVGGGAIGCEFASMMSDLGVQVTVLEALPRIIAGADKDVVDVLARSFKKRGIDVRTGVAITGHTPNESGGTTVTFGDGEQVTADMVVMSVGRRARSEGLLTPSTGVIVDERGFVPVDEYMRTGADGVYAVGDLVSTPSTSAPHPALAHVGFAEAIIAIQHILGEDPAPLDYTNVPWCIYTHPEIAFVGLTEEQAKAAGHDVVVSKHKYNGNGRALIVGESDGLVKVVAEKQPDGTGGRILGVHMAGPWVTEQLGESYLAVNWEATALDVGRLIHAHPTLSETFGETVLSLTGRGLHG
ncbi:MAG TPA: FAD-dependent oxidoreductase, partial [Acidimicrobiales bacterium]|nr:FAD-dependent oxidoreductase [Acidimicrobiales bacterium]